jgi:DNA-binding XRE family transcriptional regulator
MCTSEGNVISAVRRTLVVIKELWLHLRASYSIQILYLYKDIKSSVISSRKSTTKFVKVDWVAAGRRIRELRGFDMTQEEFAHRIGISQNYLSTVEHGKVEVGAEILLRIAREFGKSIDWLLTGSNPLQ